MDSNFTSQNRPTAELINIIKDLYYNSGGENTDERDRIIKKVEIQFNECDNRIDKYIRTSSKDLSRLIKVFNEIAKKIDNSREKVSHSREALKQCKVLLQSKRDDVRRLWLEWCEQKFFYENLAKIKQLYVSSENVRLLCSQKSYFEAATLISESNHLLEQNYREIVGLSEVKRHLQNEKRILKGYLVQELNDQLYSNVTTSVLETGAVMTNRDTSFKRRFRHHLNTLPKSDDNTMMGEPAHLVIERLVQAAGKLNTSESNVVDRMAEEVEKNIVRKLISMINSTSNHVLESNLIDNSKFIYNKNQVRQSVENNPKFLCQLIDLTYEQFKITAKNYRIFIEQSVKFGQSKFQSANIWTYIQNVIISLLDEYLDIKQVGQSVGNPSDLLDKMDVNSFFVRKRLLNFGLGSETNPSVGTGGNQTAQNSNVNSDDTGNHRIFTFKNSSHAMSITNYIREKNNEDLFSNDLSEDENNRNITENGNTRIFKILVCQPDHRNITTIFSTMEHIIKEISDEIRAIPSEQQKPELILEKYLQDFILKTFITNAVEAIKENARIHNNTSGKLEISKQLIPLSKQREMGLNKPILQNIYLVHQSCVDLFNLIRDMNSYASEFTKAMHALIEKHHDYCNKIFLSIVTNSSGPGLSENHVYSMFWVEDDAIKTYFKQLPAFSAAIKGKPSAAVLLAAAKSANNNSNNNVNTNNATKTLLSQNPAVLAATVDIEQVNVEMMSKEVETLIANLHDKELEEIDIITNFNYIEMIAHLHESCDWLIIQLKFIVNSLEQMIKNPKSLNNSLSIGELNKLVKQLDDLDKWRGDTLLILYLETRVHCFYHLINFVKQENSSSYAGDLDTDPDDCVLNLNRDLHRIYEHLSRSLQESKVNYVFDALGFMIATIFIRAVKNFKKISKHGIAKMCRNIFHVEQNLSAIRTKSDPHLMKAHRFYELLYKKPEELLNHLIEHEAEFQLNDYINILNLIYRSKPGDEIHSLAENIQSLTNILKNKL